MYDKKKGNRVVSLSKACVLYKNFSHRKKWPEGRGHGAEMWLLPNCTSDFPVQGLSLIGCHWNSEKMSICDSTPEKFFSTMPILWLEPKEEVRNALYSALKI